MATQSLSTNITREEVVPVLGNPKDQDYKKVVEDICDLNWVGLSHDDVTNVAWIYYYFSAQFCENVGIARGLYPDDERLEELDRGERNTDNLSPYPGVVEKGERVDHDEFMRRTLTLTTIDEARRRRLQAIGAAYLDKVRSIDDVSRASSLASYEDGGLEKVFRQVLLATHWEGDLLQAFHHFLEGHIALDSDPETGHGSLCRHMAPNRHVYELWAAFKDSLIEGVPGLTR
ncbi:hypothetical protein [Methylocystis heyeri]|uniref:Uncharacterized protein n=1 Tax=Methylocystis heyeri TaxID=391905 RepID=A0A6B8KEM4_9HYPH|nr:hypothetical protein [Methylocystis heyeri]QGM44893.1 hypothetical protein H2LOC_003875 [Methylocystis heyeri]